MHRLFIGLRPPPENRRLLLERMGGLSGARWQVDAQLHATVQFLGEVDRRAGEDIVAALGSIRLDPVVASLEGVGRFEERGRTTALWAGLAPRAPLAGLHKKVGQALARIGVPPDHRAYRPHITLARFARTAGRETEIVSYVARHAGATSPPFAFTHLHLFESHLARDGAQYETIARWPMPSGGLLQVPPPQ